VNLYNQAPCDDKDECTISDTCSLGKCKGSAKTCNDGNVCTDDTCKSNVPGGCVYTPNGLGCDDGDPCTVGDTCVQAKCVSGLGKLQCADGNVCTDDVCTPKVGCEFPAKPGSCDDGEFCTVGDSCDAGKCKAGAMMCECKKMSECADKEDGNLCNGTLYCDTSSQQPEKWKCLLDQATIVVCDKSEDTPCLVAQCQTDTGECIMVPVNDGGSCNDADVCTTVDTCAGGDCVGHEPKACDDANPCTKDYCHPTSDCLASVLPDNTDCGLPGFVCKSGKCTLCTPDCTGLACGDDGCGGSCGNCPQGKYCETDGKCWADCVNCAPWQSCVNSACVDPQSIGACPGGGIMLDDECWGTAKKGCCAGDTGKDLYFCGAGWECPPGYSSCLCYSACSGTKVCSYDSWYTEFVCANPPAKKDPAGKLWCDWFTCTPKCQGKNCGDDGCGGTCGTCPANFTCVNGVCDWQGLTNCYGDSWPSYSTCQGITLTGCCDLKGRNLFCWDNQLYCLNCPLNDPVCGWEWENNWYDCGTNGGIDPSGQAPITCPCVPPCPAGYSCVQGDCIKS